MTVEEKLWPDLSRGMQLEKMADEHQDLSTKAWLYNDAGTRYRIAKSWSKAATALCKSADCYKKTKEFRKAADAYADAGQVYWKLNAQEAIPCFDQAIEFFVDAGNESLAANISKAAGKLYERTRDYKHSLIYYKRSADLYEAQGMVHKRNQSKRNAARIDRAIKRKKCRKQIKMALTKILFSPSGFVKCWVGQG